MLSQYAFPLPSMLSKCHARRFDQAPRARRMRARRHTLRQLEDRHGALVCIYVATERPWECEWPSRARGRHPQRAVRRGGWRGHEGTHVLKSDELGAATHRPGARRPGPVAARARVGVPRSLTMIRIRRRRCLRRQTGGRRRNFPFGSHPPQSAPRSPSRVPPRRRRRGSLPAPRPSARDDARARARREAWRSASRGARALRATAQRGGPPPPPPWPLPSPPTRRFLGRRQLGRPHRPGHRVDYGR